MVRILDYLRFLLIFIIYYYKIRNMQIYSPTKYKFQYQYSLWCKEKSIV